MSHERFTDTFFEAKWKPGVGPEFHRAENKQSRNVEEKNVTDRINHININLINMIMPVSVSEVGEAGKPEPKNSDTGSIILDKIEMIFEAIGKMAKAILPKGKG
jgi:hypothetical protein